MKNKQRKPKSVYQIAKEGGKSALIAYAKKNPGGFYHAVAELFLKEPRKQRIKHSE